jgi:ubiquinone/menaquinone biosynthesis C-methylase UbiE
VTKTKPFTAIWRRLDRYLGRGPYIALRRRFDPESEYSQVTYARLVTAQLNSATQWLDAGCGHQSFADGFGLEEAERNMTQVARFAVGCDLGCDALEKHRSLDARVCCTLDELPFSDSSFNLVTMNNVIEHLEKPEVVFRELARIVESDGKIVIQTPNAASWLIYLIRIGRLLFPEPVVLRFIRFLEFREPSDVFPTHYRANTRKRLSHVLQSAGFEEEQTSLVCATHLFRFAAPLVIVEMLLNRALFRLGWRELGGAVMLATYRRGPRATKDERMEGYPAARDAQSLKGEEISDSSQVPSQPVGQGERAPIPVLTGKTGERA